MASPKFPDKDYYAVLDVPPDAPARLIKQNYRLLAHRYHPDHFRIPEEAQAATQRMLEINEAFAVLSDKKNRAEYDSRRAASETHIPTPAPTLDWEVLSTPAGPQTAAANPALGEAVATEFIKKLKKLVAQRGSVMKLREETEKSCLWSYSGGDWKTCYWVSLVRLPVMNINTVRSALTEFTQIISRRGSMWKNCFFVFILAIESVSDGESALKLCRSYCNEGENSTRRRHINIAVLDLNRRRSVICGKKPQDQNQRIILDTLVSG